MRKIGRSIVAMLFSATLLSCDKDFVDPDFSQLESKVNSFQASNNIPSVSVGLVQGEELIWQHAVGKSYLEENIVATSATIYKVGSIAKSYTAVLVMKLVEEGKIDLDTDISNYLPFQVRNPQFPNEKITVRHIMTHTSSIVDEVYEEKLLSHFVAIGEDHPMGLIDYERSMLTPSGKNYDSRTYTGSRPGTKYQYSNVAVTLLGCAIEHLTGQKFENFAQRELLDPLHMSSSSWKISAVNPLLLAFPYGENRENYGPFGLVDLPSGNLHATIADLGKFMSFLLQQGRYRDKQILSASSIAELRKIQFPKSPDSNLKQQGLLLEHTQIGKFKLVGHNGNVPGTNTYMWISDESKKGVVLSMNAPLESQKALNQLMEILELMFKRK